MLIFSIFCVKMKKQLIIITNAFKQGVFVNPKKIFRYAGGSVAGGVAGLFSKLCSSLFGRNLPALTEFIYGHFYWGRFGARVGLGGTPAEKAGIQIT